MPTFPNDGFLFTIIFRGNRISVIFKSMSFVVPDDQVRDLLESCKVTFRVCGSDNLNLQCESTTPDEIISYIERVKPESISVYSRALRPTAGWQQLEDWCGRHGIEFGDSNVAT
jgi:hypothetical protein